MTCHRRPIAFLLLALLASAPLAAQLAPLGSVQSEGVEVDGTLVPSGTTVFADSSVRTASYPGQVELLTGQLLRFAERSSAHISEVPDPDEGTLIQVIAGTVEVCTGDENVLLVEDESLVIAEDADPCHKALGMLPEVGVGEAIPATGISPLEWSGIALGIVAGGVFLVDELDEEDGAPVSQFLPGGN